MVSSVASNHLERSQARIDLAAALDVLFKDSTLSDQQQTEQLDFFTNDSSVFSLSPKELGKSTIAEAKFPLQIQAKPVDHHMYRTNPRAQEVIDKCVESMKPDRIIEKRLSARGSHVCNVAEADGLLCFFVDYRNTRNRFHIRETWPMLDIEYHIDTNSGAEFNTVYSVQSNYWQIPIAKKLPQNGICNFERHNTSLKYCPSASPTHLGDFNVQCPLHLSILANGVK